MSLHIELGPSERIIIGGAMVINGPCRWAFFIEGRAAILRERDIITPEQADTPCKRLYLAIEMAYLAENSFEADNEYIALAKQIAEAAPSCKPYLTEISSLVMLGDHYKAIKACKFLLDHEALLLKCVNGQFERVQDSLQ